jgi:hypothetical protein
VPQVTFSLGKFNAPIGFESLDAPYIYQFSHALLFTYTPPTNLTGLRADAALSDGWASTLYAVNGWDRNDETDALQTYGGRLAYRPRDGWTFGLSAISGVDEASGDSAFTFTRSVVDADISIQAAPNLLIGGEMNHGWISAGDAELDWFGVMVLAHANLNAWLGMTLRVDQISDDDGWIFGRAGGEVRRSFTAAPTFTMGDGMASLIELRVDTSDEDVFLDDEGRAQGATTSVAFEATYSF